MANLFIELGYPVEIICVYRMPNSPAFPLNAQVQVTYLLKNTPNRQQWKECLKKKRLFQLIKESIKAIRILLHKKYSVYRAIRNIQDGIIITTRHEDTLVLSKYGRSNVFKIAQPPFFSQSIPHNNGFFDIIKSYELEQKGSFA